MQFVRCVGQSIGFGPSVAVLSLCVPRICVALIEGVAASQGSQNSFELSGLIRHSPVTGIELPQTGHDASDAMPDSASHGQANLWKNCHCRNSKDKLEHEHFGELRGSRAVLKARDLAVTVVPDYISQFPLSQTETAPKNSHQVSVAWWVVLQIRVWLCRFFLQHTH